MHVRMPLKHDVLSSIQGVPLPDLPCSPCAPRQRACEGLPGWRRVLLRSLLVLRQLLAPLQRPSENQTCKRIPSEYKIQSFAALKGARRCTCEACRLRLVSAG